VSGRTPWWYSGDEPEPRSDGQPEPSPEPSGADEQPASLDWTALLTGAARMVDWATSAVMAPHAEHDDPEQYPDCVVCRTLVLVGEPAPPPSPGPEPAEPITWIPFRD
jgi:hypothetical protein